MPLLFFDRITRADLRANPERLYVFGDNLERKGLGGLARQCRGEPNAVGIPTKRRPSMAEDAFFSDDDLDVWRKAAKPAWDRIEAALRDGKIVIFPKGGIGTGLAELPKRAPKIVRAIEARMEALRSINIEVEYGRTANGRKTGRGL